MAYELNDQNETIAAACRQNGLRLKEEIRWQENIIAARLKNDKATIFRTCRQLFYQRLNP